MGIPVDEIILPSQTRTKVIRALTALKHKRTFRPVRRHGNVPL